MQLALQVGSRLRATEPEQSDWAWAAADSGSAFAGGKDPALLSAVTTGCELL